MGDNKQFKGIDVSKWNASIDWTKVKASGIDFAMIRLGYGSPDGTKCGIDSYFKKNVEGAVKAGVDIGCYFYSYATSVEATKKEAKFVLDVLKNYKGVFTYPIAYDLEDSTQIKLGTDTLTNMVIAFCDTIEVAGYYAVLYSNLNWLYNYLRDSKLIRFDHWVAQWSSVNTYNNKTVMGMWQYSSQGKVSGINGNVDMNISYKDYPTIIRSNLINGFEKEKPVTDKPAEPEPTTPSTPKTEFKVGDIVEFRGQYHYPSADSNRGVLVYRKGKAKITQIYIKGKHPYHCRSVNDSGAFVGGGVYGWVDEKDISILSPSDGKKAIRDVAFDVILGKYGNGQARKDALKKAGYDPDEVQKMVNAILKGATK